MPIDNTCGKAIRVEAEVAPFELGRNVDDKRDEIIEKIEDSIDSMHDIITGRMEDVENRIAAAGALSDLARTWEGMMRGEEKSWLASIKRRSPILNEISGIADYPPLKVFEKEIPDDKEKSKA